MSYYLLVGEEVKEVPRDEWLNAHHGQRYGMVKQTEILDHTVETEFDGMCGPNFRTRWVGTESDPITSTSYEDAMREHNNMIQEVKILLRHDKEALAVDLINIVNDLRQRIKQLEERLDDLTQNND